MSRAEHLLVQAGTWLVAGSGAAYFWMKYMMKGDDPFSALHHPWQARMLALHVVAAPVLVFALGLILRGHIIEKYREKKPHPSRLSGVVALVQAVPMVATGYLIQVVTDETGRRILVIAHLASGGLYLGSMVIHLAAARLQRRLNGAARAQSSLPATPGQRLDRP